MFALAIFVMSLGYRKSSKLSLSVSLFWIVGFVALLLRGSDSLLDGLKLAAFEKGNTTLELLKGNGVEINKTLRIDGSMDKISFVAHRPGCVGKDEDDNSVVFWLGDGDARKMRLMWNGLNFILIKDGQKINSINVMPTETDVLVTLKEDGSATVSSDGPVSLSVELFPFDLKDKLVKFSMKGNTKCGMKLEFDKNVHDYDAEEPLRNAIVEKKKKEELAHKKKMEKPNTENKLYLGMSLGLFIVVVLIAILVLLAGITAVVVYFCCCKRGRSKAPDLEAQNQQGADNKSAASDAWKMGDSAMEVSCESKTPIEDGSKPAPPSDDSSWSYLMNTDELSEGYKALRKKQDALYAKGYPDDSDAIDVPGRAKYRYSVLNHGYRLDQNWEMQRKREGFRRTPEAYRNYKADLPYVKVCAQRPRKLKRYKADHLEFRPALFCSHRYHSESTDSVEEADKWKKAGKLEKDRPKKSDANPGKWKRKKKAKNGKPAEKQKKPEEGQSETIKKSSKSEKKKKPEEGQSETIKKSDKPEKQSKKAEKKSIK